MNMFAYEPSEANTLMNTFLFYPIFYKKCAKF
jgi:hypothetical protein